MNRRRGLVLGIFAVFWMQLLIAQNSVEFNSEYRYLKGKNAAALSTNWLSKSFNDSDWQTGNAPFWYGKGSEGVLLSDMQYSYSTIYLRKTFQLEKTDSIEGLTVVVNYDDGFIIWLNGEKLLSQNAPANPNYQSFAPATIDGIQTISYSFSKKQLSLVEGENQIAVQVFNRSLDSSDLHFAMSLSVNYPISEIVMLDDKLQVEFSQTSGFYNSNFSVSISAPSNEYEVWYTLDYSDPRTSATAIKKTGSSTVQIDPTSTNNRPKTPVVILRACLKKGDQFSWPITQSYIFISEVITQSHPGGNWPTSNVNGQFLDFDMDSKVTNSRDYYSAMDDALLDIPSISLVTDNKNLFDAQTGIYVNAMLHGIEWERFTSVELINPDGSMGFNTNCGMRIRGGWSRHDEYPKRAFRLFFRDEYGDGKLNFPLFEDEGVDKIDNVDLRTAQNYSWNNGGGTHNTFVREVFSRDTQRDMGQAYTRSRYYHLYLNGMYWGLYQTQERSEANFGGSYFGGSKEDFDVIKANGDYSGNIEATDGNLEAWQTIFNYSKRGFKSDANYFKLEGKDENGNQQKNSEVLVDIDNLIDYMLVIFFTGNFDAPVSAFRGNVGVNNFFTIFRRDDKTQGFKFFAHDCEHSMLTKSEWPGVGLYENRTILPNMHITNFANFNPQWLHHKLSENENYRIRFADRVQKHFFHNGALTVSNCRLRFNDRAQQINMAIIAESARWGDTRSSQARTKNDDWLPEINEVLNNYLPKRHPIVLDQLKEAMLFPSVDAVVFKKEGQEILANDISFSKTFTLIIHNTNRSGTIYISRNGEDPRLLDGNINTNAIIVNNGSGIQIKNTTQLKCRILNNGTWSALRTLNLKSEYENYDKLKVTELHYHPVDSIVGNDTISGKSFEFIELKNTGSSAIALENLQIASAVSYSFPPEEILEPNQFYVIASSPKWFYERYGLIPSGNYKANFSNSGEHVSLTANGNLMLQFSYSDKAPWPTDADGKGYSLVSALKNPTENPNDYTYWKLGTIINGTPFADDPAQMVNKPIIEIPKLLFKVYPNPTSNLLYIENSTGEVNAKVEVFNLLGKRIYESTLEKEMAIELKYLEINQSMVFLRLTMQNHTSTHKILINI